MVGGGFRADADFMLRIADDERLAKLAAAGSGSAFGALYRRHESRLLMQCRCILGNEEEARDALQNAMIKALAALQAGQLRGAGSGGWARGLVELGAGSYYEGAADGYTAAVPPLTRAPGSSALISRMPSIVSTADGFHSSSPVVSVNVSASKISSSGSMPCSSQTSWCSRCAISSFR